MTAPMIWYDFSEARNATTLPRSAGFAKSWVRDAEKTRTKDVNLIYA